MMQVNLITPEIKRNKEKIFSPVLFPGNECEYLVLDSFHHSVSTNERRQGIDLHISTLLPAQSCHSFILCSISLVRHQLFKWDCNSGYQLVQISEFCDYADEKASVRWKKSLCFMGVDTPDIQQNSFNLVSVFSVCISGSFSLLHNKFLGSRLLFCPQGNW